VLLLFYGRFLSELANQQCQADNFMDEVNVKVEMTSFAKSSHKKLRMIMTHEGIKHIMEVMAAHDGISQ